MTKHAAHDNGNAASFKPSGCTSAELPSKCLKLAPAIGWSPSLDGFVTNSQLMLLRGPAQVPARLVGRVRMPFPATFPAT